MRIANFIKVGLVKPPLEEHLGRGTGTYFYNLYENLKENKKININIINLNDPVSGFDLVHYPYFDPFFITMPLLGNLGRIPGVVTVHDLIPLKYPDKFPIGLRGLFKWHIQSSSLKRSSAVITDSIASKNDIVRITDIKEEKVKVIYLGVNSDFKKLDGKSLLPAKKKLNLPDKFILNVGDVNYNKNIDNIIKSFSILASKSPDLYLLFVGRGFISDSPQLMEILSLIKKNRLENRVLRLANLTKEDLVSVYNMASIYIQPSFDEGFGLPILEAFACQTPVVSSSAGSLPEIAGNAALFVDPNKYHEIAESAISLFSNKSLREKLISEGNLQLKKFTWKKTADETIRLYEEVLGINKFN